MLRFVVYLLLIAVCSCALLGGCKKPPKNDGAGGPPEITAPAGGGDSGASADAGQATAVKWTGNAQDFDVKYFDGKSGKISDYAGKPVVVNFWAVW
jgi:hypothetical protein